MPDSRSLNVTLLLPVCFHLFQGVSKLCKLQCYLVIIILASFRGRSLGLSELVFYLLEGLSLPLPDALGCLRPQPFSVQRLHGRRGDFAKFQSKLWASCTGTIHSFIIFYMPDSDALGTSCPCVCRINSSWFFPVFRKVLRRWRKLGLQAGPRTQAFLKVELLRPGEEAETVSGLPAGPGLRPAQSRMDLLPVRSNLRLVPPPSPSPSQAPLLHINLDRKTLLTSRP